MKKKKIPVKLFFRIGSCANVQLHCHVLFLACYHALLNYASMHAIQVGTGRLLACVTAFHLFVKTDLNFNS